MRKKKCCGVLVTIKRKNESVGMKMNMKRKETKNN